jgi:uncharacterized protein (DUF488 family)
MARPPTILTIGHGAREIDAFLDLLHAVGVERVVDVRTAPGSRRHPQFGRDALGDALEGAGIGYVWRGADLGGFRRPLPDSPHTAIRNDSFRGYADHMDTTAFAEALGWLIETSRDDVTAVMCAETLWWRCHRRMIADALVARGGRVQHVMDGPRLEEHRLHPNARLEGAHIVYDVGDQPSLGI